MPRRGPELVEPGPPSEVQCHHQDITSLRTPTLPHRPCQVGMCFSFLLRSQLPIVVRRRLPERAACGSGGSLEAQFFVSGVLLLSDSMNRVLCICRSLLPRSSAVVSWYSCIATSGLRATPADLRSLDLHLEMYEYSCTVLYLLVGTGGVTKRGEAYQCRPTSS